MALYAFVRPGFGMGVCRVSGWFWWGFSGRTATRRAEAVMSTHKVQEPEDKDAEKRYPNFSTKTPCSGGFHKKKPRISLSTDIEGLFCRALQNFSEGYFEIQGCQRHPCPEDLLLRDLATQDSGCSQGFVGYCEGATGASSL